MRSMFVIIFLLIASVSSFAAGVSSPTQIVQNLYKPYLSNSSHAPSALESILPYASQSLKAAILKNEECELRTHEICSIDFDIIVNGQDWQLSNLSVSGNEKVSAPAIQAKFLNFETKNKVIYYFIRENGNWKINEVEAISYKADGSVDYSVKLKHELNAQ